VQGEKTSMLKKIQLNKGLGQPTPKYWRVDSQTSFPQNLGVDSPNLAVGMGVDPRKNLNKKKEKPWRGWVLMPQDQVVLGVQ
jgi:hypothetical protein